MVNNMNRKTQSDKQSMTSLQRQAVLVCVVCALAALLTIGITLTLLKRGKPEVPADQPASSEPAGEDPAGEDLSEHYQIDNTSSALLAETADAGTEYLDSTLFLGDSNTVRLYNNGLISLQQFCAKEGIGTQAALNDGIVTFKNNENHYTIAQAVAMMKPRRVVITLGTNDTGMSVEDFIRNYTALVQAIQASYPYTDIIVNTVPPIPADHSTYPHMDQAKIDDFNMALLGMCEQLGIKFLNTAEVLKGEDGYGIADYYTGGDIHLKSAGLKAVLNYLRTHACQTEDRRPDTGNIPVRTLEYSSNPSSAVQAPSSEEPASESASSSESKTAFEARYQVEKGGGGTLSCGSDSGKTSLIYDITDASQSLTVTAVPAEGYVFVKWSDGVTSKTRTDSKFKQNLDVTAVFGAASVHISNEGKGLFGGNYIFKASVSGKYAKSGSLRWFANGEEVTAAAGQTTVSVSASSIRNGTYKIYAVISYNDCTVTSNTLTLTVSGASESTSGSTSSSSSESGKSESASSGSSSGSSSSSSSSGSGSSGAESSSGSTSHGSAESESGSKSESTSSSASHSSSASASESKSEPASSSHSESHSSSASESKAESASSGKAEETSKASSAENDLTPESTASSSGEATASR